jgi:hypothetical protein
MAKQTFSTGQVLTSAQMTSLQANDYNQTVSAKTASYVLAAADAGTTITMNAAGATTITVNTSLFTAGDTLRIANIGAGVCTVTAGTATVTTAGSLALVQWAGGMLYFTSASASIFFPDAVASSSSQIAIFNETQAAGTNGGAITAATWTKRTLNTTQVNTLTGCSIASSVITLAAGTYLICAQPNGDTGDIWKARLQNTTDATTTLFSQNAYSNSASGYATTIAPIMGTFTITAQKNFEIQQYAQTLTGATGLGRGSAAYTSLFTQVTITRFA